MPEDRSTKAWLRKDALEKRKALTGEELIWLNNQILLFFSEWPFSGVQYMHSFFPIADQFEPDARLLMDWMCNHHPEIRIVLSKSDFKNSSMRHFVWDKDTIIEESRAGILEPVGGTEIPANLLDIILVPLLAIDIHGNRVGYGKGFYDRFLAQCRPDAQKIGLSFFDPVPVIEDASLYDIPLDACITPSGVCRFNGI